MGSDPAALVSGVITHEMVLAAPHDFAAAGEVRQAAAFLVPELSRGVGTRHY